MLTGPEAAVLCWSFFRRLYLDSWRLSNDTSIHRMHAMTVAPLEPRSVAGLRPCPETALELRRGRAGTVLQSTMKVR